MKKIFILLGLIPTFVFAQDQSFSSKNNTYIEAKNSEKTDTSAWKSQVKNPQFTFASSNIRYAKEKVPQQDLVSTWKTKAWKGEKVHTQLLFFSPKSTQLTLKVKSLTNGKGSSIAQNQVQASFVRYVKTDVFAGGCGVKNTSTIDSSLVADPIDLVQQLAYQAFTTQPIWLNVAIPENAATGIYKGEISVNNQVLPFEIVVVDHTLPPAKAWHFDLDYWQHPYAIARVHGVKAWSKKHYELMRTYYTLLAQAGQKVITASIINEPWNHQTYDDYPSLVQWTKKKNGTWKYDYRLFDQYIQFVMSCGIDQRINCYSMIPWKIQFEYFDEKTGKKTYFTQGPGSDAYNEFWGTMLKDFRKHLIAKGWFEKTAIAMDERDLKDMQAVIKLIKGIDKNFKLSLAGRYHEEIEPFIDDYCVASEYTFPVKILQKRKSLHQASTVYTCCTEEYPNGFTFSPPAENAWLPWYAASKGFTGYVRWAYNSWVAQPLIDSRFKTWPGGDTFQIYPGPRSSIRFEKMIEGIQDFEKIQILKQEFEQQKNTEKLEALNRVLAAFKLENLSKTPAKTTLEAAKTALEKLY